MSKSKNKIFSQCNLYISLYVIYELQDVIYPSGIINQAIQLILILWGLLISWKYLLTPYCSLPLLKSTKLLIWMYSIYGIIYLIFPIQNGELIPTPYWYLQTSLNSLLPIFTFYVFSKKGQLNPQIMRSLFFILLGLTICHYFLAQQRLIQEALERGSSRTEFTNNTGYEFVGLFPLIFFFRKKIIQFSLIFILLFFIFLTFKRGAILLCIINVMYYLYASYKYAETKQMKRIIRVCTFFLIISSSSLFLKVYNESDFLKFRLEQTKEGNSSQRDILYEKVVDSYLNSTSFIDLIIGKGANSTISAAGNYAHQDWLETMHCNGILGLCLLLYFFITMYQTYKKIRKNFLHTKLFFLSISFYSLIIICIGKSLFSMSIQNLNYSSSILLGYFCYLQKK